MNNVFLSVVGFCYEYEHNDNLYKNTIGTSIVQSIQLDEYVPSSGKESGDDYIEFNGTLYVSNGDTKLIPMNELYLITDVSSLSAFGLPLID